MGCQYIVAIYTNFPWATLPNDWLIISIIRMIGVQMIYNDFNYEIGFPEPTRTVRGSDYSPAIELSEQKDKLVTATGDI